VAAHARLAEPGYFVRGPRVQLHRDLTEFVLTQDVHVHRWRCRRWFNEWRRGQVNQFLPLLRLPLGPLRKWTRRRWAGIRGSNLGVWREDFLAVNGFDEAFEGWGYEDWDFVGRLSKRGVELKEGRFVVPVLHLWHESHEGLEVNRDRFERQRASNRVWAEQGVSQYLERPRSEA
jgi:GT2 family glycosyltransferase